MDAFDPGPESMLPKRPPRTRGTVAATVALAFVVVVVVFFPAARLFLAISIPIGVVCAVIVPALSDGKTGFSVTIPANWDRGKPRVGLAADIVAEGKYLGQIAEALADIDFT